MCTVTCIDPSKFFHAFEQLLRDHRSDCIVSDWAYTWPSDFGVPRVVFDVSSPFSLCAYNSIAEAADDDGKPLVLSGGRLPHRMEMTRSELPTMYKESPALVEVLRETEKKCVGDVSNGFYEPTPEFVDHYYNKVLGGC